MLNSLLRPIAVFVLLTVSFLTYGQYGNEWIDYSKTYYSFDIGEDGLYRIPYETISASGMPTDPAALRLYNAGALVPIYISDLDNFGPGDYIEFVGKHNSGYFDRQLYADPEWHPNDAESLFSDFARYYLVSDSSLEPNLFVDVDNDLSNPPTAEPYFVYDKRTSFDFRFARGVQGNGNSFGNLSDFEEGEGFYTTIISDFPFQTNLITEGLNTEADIEASISAQYLSESNATWTFIDHHINISLNDNVVLDHTQAGQQLSTIDNTFSTSFLGDPVTQLKFENLDDLDIDPQDGDYNASGSLAYVDLSYPRNFSFGNDPYFEFELDKTAALYFEAADFDGGSSIVLYDLENKTRYTANQTNGHYPFHLAASSASRKLILASTEDNAVVNITSLSTKEFTDYSDPANIGNFVIIYHPDLREGSETDQIERYRAYRASNEGGNNQVLMANIFELYDQFAHGIRNHPLGVRNFTNYIFTLANENDWPIKPDLLLLLGRSVSYDDSRDINSPGYALNLIPTYGESGSDNLLSAIKGLNHLPVLGTGRISAENGEILKNYLDKLIVYEGLINQTQPCTKEARQWMKHALHLGGGNNLAEAESFTNYLNGYEDIITQNAIGAEVVGTYVKSESGVVEGDDIPPELIEAVNNGLLVLTLFGHSSAEIFDFGLADPEDYDNFDRYSFLMSNSCFIGDVHQPADFLLALRYVLIEDRGFVAFLATVGLGYPTFLNRFSTRLFQNATGGLYGAPLGAIIRQAHTDNFFDALAQPGGLDFGTIIHSQEFTLQGDPGMPLYHFDRPEYMIEESDVFINPSQPTIETENIILQFVVNNLGRAVTDSVEVLVDHTLPDGSINVLFEGKVPPVAYRDTLGIVIPNDAAYFGINGIRIIIDPDNNIQEDCEDNNQFNKSLLVLSDQPVPIEPCELAIVSDPQVVLKANTPKPIMPSANYLFEIDTLATFDSPGLVNTAINQVGGVISWEPAINYVDGQVYYWRVTRDIANPIWQNSSFVYNENAPTGWSQSTNELLSQNVIENLNWEDDLSAYTYVFGFDEGSVRSPAIGPANDWVNLEWAANVEDNDSVWIEVWSASNPQDLSGTELLLSDDVNPIDLSGIDAEQHPFILLRFYTYDDEDDTPSQLNNWQVYFEKVPELSFNQSLSYAFSSDTISNNANGEFVIGISNVNQYASGAIETDCRIITANNVSQAIECPDLNALDGFSDSELTFSFETTGLSGNNILQIELNPQPSFNEKYYFNNLLEQPFFVENDLINPIVDVSFDGVNIMHNELVSSQPDILIQIRDENTVQALMDTSIAEIFLTYPSGAMEQISLDDPAITFTPADLGNLETENVAHIGYKPNFTEDGFYQLFVKASDANGNQSSDQYDYSISFEVVTTNSISNVVNYPNPFTTSTQFVYTLAGSEIPSVFRIQVMTPGGRVVREFGQDELGTPRFGKNISEFVWDGTDTYGNELANGVYFFRVIANTSDGEALELYSNEFTKRVDDSFGEYSVGKMYKLR